MCSSVRHLSKLGGRQPPNCSGWEGALVRRGEGRGPAPNTGFRLSRRPKIKGGVGLSQSHTAFFWGGGCAETPCAVVARIAHVHSLSKRCNTLCGKRVGRSGWEKLGVGWADVPSTRGYSCSKIGAAGNRALANWATGLSSTVAANLAARCGGGVASGLAPLAPCSSLTWCFFARHFNKFGGGQPPAAVAGMGACQVRGGAGPRTKHGVLVQLTPQKTREAWG